MLVSTHGTDTENAAVYALDAENRLVINKQELELLQRYAKALLACDDATIDLLIARSDLGEICHEEKK